MKISYVALAASLAVAAPAYAEEEAPEIVVTAHHADDRIDLPPATRATIDADEIATRINALSVEDTLKYAPSLVVRKRHVGDNFAPIATRTSGLGASARSLIYADGVLLSAFIANNNGNGSPRWTLVAPEEIERIEVLYGPFSAAYPGNAIGTTVNITTRLPDRLEASARAVVNIQQFDLYGTQRTLPTWQVAASLGDRFGPLSLFAACTRTDAQSQPVTIISTAGTADPSGTTGGFADRNRTGAAIRVIGAGGLEHHRQNTWKLKAALDLGGNARISYLFGIWNDDTESTVDSYLRSTATGATAYTGAFNSGVYLRNARHTAHAVTFEGSTHSFDWHVVGTSYHYDHDLQAGPTGALPGGFAGGAGSLQRQDGTGWLTLDAKAAWRPRGDNRHVLSLGFHADRYRLVNATANWLAPSTPAATIAASRGRTRTLAVWAQDRLRITPTLTLTLGARYEWWRAWDGYSLTSTGSLVQAERRAARFSPKAAIEWGPDEHWSARLSFGRAWRFPTVGELYQATTVGTQLANPNPDLRPERVTSEEFALSWHDAQGSVRLSLFNEVVDDALISQTSILTPTISSSYVQNVERTRARGLELALERRNVVPGLDLQASVTYADARTVRNPAFPGSVGKLLPSVPHWKGSAVVTWRPDERWSLIAAARFTSRNWGTLDNRDIVGQTYQGFYKYFVVDLRANWRASEHLDLGFGIDNVNNDKYFLFHPFPQRSFSADIKWKL